MASDDPFELLKKKLEAKKKAARKPAPAQGSSKRPPGAPPPLKRPAARRPQGAGPPKARPAGGGAWLDPAAGPAAKGKPRKVVPKAGRGAAGPKKPLKIIRNAWSKEDLERMKNSKETTKDGPPSGFTSHRYDSGIDPKRVRARKQASKDPGRRPKGFRSDRADRK